MLNGKLKSSMLNGNALSICMLTLITLEEGGEGGKEWYYWINYSRLNSTVLINHIKGVGKKPPDFKLMLLCVQAVTAKGRPTFIIIKKPERKKQLSGYKQCYIYKNQNLEVSKYMNSALVMCNRLNPRG